MLQTYLCTSVHVTFFPKHDLSAHLIPWSVLQLEGYDDTDAPLVIGKYVFALDSGRPRQMNGLKGERGKKKLLGLL